MTTRRRSWGKIRKIGKRWYPSYVGEDGVRYSSSAHGQPASFRTKLDAETWLGTIKRSVDLGTWRAPGSEIERGLTLRSYADQWLTTRALKPRTKALYEDLLRLHVLPTLGDLKLTSITPAAVRVWHSELSTGPTRKAHSYSLLHAICATAVSDELLDANPCRIRSAMQTKRKRDIELVTPAELASLAAAMPAELSCAVLILGWCGLRSGELKELRRKDIGVDAATIRVERAVTTRNRITTVDTPKTAAGQRKIAVPPHIRQAILDHLDSHVGAGKEALLFAATDGGHLGDWQLRKAFEKARDSIGKPDLRIHDLRHVGAVLAAQTGATTKELMNRLGHTTPQMAMRYQSVADGRDDMIARKLSELAGL